MSHVLELHVAKAVVGVRASHARVASNGMEGVSSRAASAAAMRHASWRMARQHRPLYVPQGLRRASPPAMPASITAALASTLPAAFPPALARPP